MRGRPRAKDDPWSTARSGTSDKIDSSNRDFDPDPVREPNNVEWKETLVREG